MKNAFDGLSSRLDTAEDRISELENISVEISKSAKQKEQRLKKKKQTTEYPRTVGQLQKCYIHLLGMPEGEEREKGTEKIFETTITENFLKLISDTKPLI